MKKIKIILIAGFTILSLVTTSCNQLYDTIMGAIVDNALKEDEAKEEANDTTDVYLQNRKSDVYFIQVNNTGYSINEENVGGIAVKTNERAVENNEEELLTNIQNCNYAYNKDYYHEKARLITEQLSKDVNYNYARAARTATNEEEGDTEEVTVYETKIRDNTQRVDDCKSYYYIIHNSLDGKDYYTYAKGVCKAEGKYCNVIFIKDNELVKEAEIDFKTVAEKFDSIYEKETAIVGNNQYKTKYSPYIIDPVKKIDVIIADIFEKATEKQEGGVFGYFTSADCWNYDKNTNNGSNETQAIYLDSYFLKTQTNAVYSTLVHEFNHLLNYCQKNIYYGLDNLSTWYTEMLSMTMEDLFQHVLELDDSASSKSRLGTFNWGSYLGFEDWLSGDAIYNSYANAYAFGAYLVRNFGGVELLKEIATNKYTDKESITQALKKLNYDLDYNKALKYFPMIAINVDTTLNSEAYKKYITLNRDISYSRELYFDAINLNDYIWYYSETETAKGPLYLKTGYVLPLNQSGFMINYVSRKKDFIFRKYNIKEVSDNNYYAYFVNYNKSYN